MEKMVFKVKIVRMCNRSIIKSFNRYVDACNFVTETLRCIEDAGHVEITRTLYNEWKQITEIKTEFHYEW